MGTVYIFTLLEFPGVICDQIVQAQQFPVAGILPKEEIGVSSLLAQNPQVDGRGQIIAVLDQGVDPGAAGLSLTSEGKPKLYDIIDTTGSGDVDTSKVVNTETDSEGDFITGLTGRKLRIPDSWSNASKEKL